MGDAFLKLTYTPTDTLSAYVNCVKVLASDFDTPPADWVDLRVYDDDEVMVNREVVANGTGGAIIWTQSDLASGVQAELRARILPGEGDMALALRQAVWDANYGMVHHFEDSGALDSTQYANNAVEVGTAGFGATGIMGKGLGLVSGTPTQNYLTVPRSASTEPTTGITCELWFNISTYSEWACYFNKARLGMGWDGGYSIIMTATEMYFAVKGATPAYLYLSGLPNLLSAWHYVVGTYNGAAFALYLDGISIGTVPATGSITYGSDEYDLWIGSEAYSGGRWMPTGTMDELRISGVGRSAASIAMNYAQQSGDVWAKEWIPATGGMAPGLIAMLSRTVRIPSIGGPGI